MKKDKILRNFYAVDLTENREFTGYFPILGNGISQCLGWKR